MSIRERINFIPHDMKEWNDPALASQGITNLVHESNNPDEQWVVDITKKIGDWRSKARSTYVRWSLTINGLYLGEEKYRKWEENRRFIVNTMRPGPDGGVLVPMAEWSGEEAANNHKATADLIAAFGVVDLYGCLEEIVFDAYRIYLCHHPLEILPSSEYRELRRLYNQAKEEPSLMEAWEVQWHERLNAWHRKHIYDGLGKVFLAFTGRAKLKKPHWYVSSDPQTWAAIISGISELRNLITHGCDVVSKELSEISQGAKDAGFDFKEGDRLVVKLNHMMGVECFIDQLLTALNASIIERVRGPQPPLKIILG